MKTSVRLASTFSQMGTNKLKLFFKSWCKALTMSHKPIAILTQAGRSWGQGQPRQLSNEDFYSPPYIALAEALLCLGFKGWHCMLVHGAYLGHVIQTVENVLSCFFWLNPCLCFMVIWCLVKRGKSRLVMWITSRSLWLKTSTLCFSWRVFSHLLERRLWSLLKCPAH